MSSIKLLEIENWAVDRMAWKSRVMHTDDRVTVTCGFFSGANSSQVCSVIFWTRHEVRLINKRFPRVTTWQDSCQEKGYVSEWVSERRRFYVGRLRLTSAQKKMWVQWRLTPPSPQPPPPPPSQLPTFSNVVLHGMLNKSLASSLVLSRRAERFDV